MRHFISGRLIQVSYYKALEKMGQTLTLASSKEGVLEQHGSGISSKKILKSGGRVQNYVFNLISRTTEEESTLSAKTVMNIQNLETKLFLATSKLAASTEIDSDDEEME